jgi:hypothetical protein
MYKSLLCRLVLLRAKHFRGQLQVKYFILCSIDSPTRCTLYVFFIPLYFALHVSGAICTHPQEHKLQRTAMSMCNGCGMLIQWSRYWLGHPHTVSPNLTVLKVWGCSSQYLPQWINIPQPLHIPMAVRCSWCSWGWAQIAPETCPAKYTGIKNTYSVHLVGLSIECIHYQDVRNHEHQILFYFAYEWCEI